MDKKAIIETVKEAARIAYFAALAAVVVYLQSKLGGMDQSTALVVVGTFVLKLVDKYVNKSAVPSNGIAPTFLQK